MVELERKARRFSPVDVLKAVMESPIHSISKIGIGRMGPGETAHLLVSGRQERLSLGQEDPPLPPAGTTVIIYTQGRRP